MRKEPHVLNPLFLVGLAKEWIKARDKSEYPLVFAVVLIIHLALWVALPAFVGYKILGTKPFWHYSEGEMKAKALKISEKGLIWKTHEGYVLTGSLSEGVAEKWNYSTTDLEVVECVNSNKEVILHYDQYIFVPFSVGDTDHIVTKCEGVH